VKTYIGMTDPARILTAYLLIGVGADGDTRESHQCSLDEAIAIGLACSAEDESGPPWKCWEVWGNHPETGEWTPLVQSCHSSP